MSKLGEAPVRQIRSLRLLSENTNDAQLKQDVEKLCLENSTIGAHKIAVYPESWLYYERRYDGHVIMKRSDTFSRGNDLVD